MEVKPVSDMIAGIYIPPEEKTFDPPHNCVTCKNMWAPMYNGPCRDCIYNSSLLGKTEPVDRWEPEESE